MPPQLLIGILLGAVGAALLYLLLTRQPARRRSESGEPVDPSGVEDRAGAGRAPASPTRVPGLERARAADNLPADVQDRMAGLPFVVEKRSTQKIVININGEHHEYDSLNEVPVEFRDLIEKARRSASSRITIEVNGKRYTYNSREEVPQVFRHLLPPEQVG